METVKSQAEIVNLEKNWIEGNPEITNSTISFKGNNNILYCDGNVISYELPIFIYISNL